MCFKNILDKIQWWWQAVHQKPNHAKHEDLVNAEFHIYLQSSRSHEWLYIGELNYQASWTPLSFLLPLVNTYCFLFLFFFVIPYQLPIEVFHGFPTKIWLLPYLCLYYNSFFLLQWFIFLIRVARRFWATIIESKDHLILCVSRSVFYRVGAQQVFTKR